MSDSCHDPLTNLRESKIYFVWNAITARMDGAVPADKGLVAKRLLVQGARVRDPAFVAQQKRIANGWIQDTAPRRPQGKKRSAWP